MEASVLIAFLCGCLAFALYLLSVSIQGMRAEVRVRMEGIEGAIREASSIAPQPVSAGEVAPIASKPSVKRVAKPRTWSEVRETAERAAMGEQ